MCTALFDFYPEPERPHCNFVKSKWVVECHLRVDLIEQKSKGLVRDAGITQAKLDHLYDDIEPEYRPMEKVQVEAAPVEIPKNVYMQEYGDYILSDAEVKAVKNALNRKMYPSDKKKLLNKWHYVKKGRLRNGLKSEAELPAVRAFFEKQVADHEANLDLNIDQLDYQAIEIQKKAFAEQTWDDYNWFLNKNSQKMTALKKLARVSCNLGGRNWSRSCDDLLSFYDIRDAKILKLRENQESVFRDLKWAMDNTKGNDKVRDAEY